VRENNIKRPLAKCCLYYFEKQQQKKILSHISCIWHVKQIPFLASFFLLSLDYNLFSDFFISKEMCCCPLFVCPFWILINFVFPIDYQFLLIRTQEIRFNLLKFASIWVPLWKINRVADDLFWIKKVFEEINGCNIHVNLLLFSQKLVITSSYSEIWIILSCSWGRS
jgi:hypothetical protein